MAIFRCKSCGGDLDAQPGASVVECEYCGNKQTLPKVTDENLQALFNRANFLRQKCDFDKAEKLYEKILEQDERESEAYWGVILCKFGIEYVKDPGTENRIPTCHRASYDSIVADDYYKQAIKYADVIQRPVYEAEAKKIDAIQKQILEISRKEKPYDVFICYKETDENGQRTHDSVTANDIYYQLTQEGFKVFYAAITLEGKLGSDYEAVIFAALNSAKVMLAVGSKPEYFQATWVRNEWSRYLHIMKKDRSRLLIPCYSGMDPYDLPEEFAHLQAQDMSKIGFINDLVRGIKKVIVKEAPKAAPAAAPAAATSAVAPLVKRAFMFLEDGEFDRADDLCEQVLNQDPENAMAYVGKLMASLRVRKMKGLGELANTFENDMNYKKAIRFGDEDLKDSLKGYNDAIRNRNATAKQEQVYAQADTLARGYNGKPENLRQAAELFRTVSSYKDSAQRAKDCEDKAKEIAYKRGCDLIENGGAKNYQQARELFLTVRGYKDADKLAADCAELAKDADYSDAMAAMKNAESGRDYGYAANLFKMLGSYKDAPLMEKECRSKKEKAEKEELYEKSVGLMSGSYTPDKLDTAIKNFESLGKYKDSQAKITECYNLKSAYYTQLNKARRAEKMKKMRTTIIVVTVIALIMGAIIFASVFTEMKEQARYDAAVALVDAGEYEQAIAALTEFDFAYKDIGSLLYKARTNLIIQYFGEGKIAEAEQLWTELEEYHIVEDEERYMLTYHQASAYANAGDYSTAYQMYNSIYDYSDVQEKIKQLRTSVMDKIEALVAEEKYQEAYDLIQALDFSEEEIPYEAREMIRYLALNDYRGAVDSGMTVVVLPEGTTEVSDGMFAYCENLEAITLPSTITYIGTEAFRGCTNLKSIIIPNGVTVISDYAFMDCTALTEVTIPDTVTEIQTNAFRNCTALTNINIPAGVTAIGDAAFYGCTGLLDATIPAGVTSIGGSAFFGCESFKNVTVPSGVTFIGAEAFGGCIALESITVPFIGDRADADETGSQYFRHIFYEVPESLKTVVVTGGTFVGDSAFEDCSAITKITLPDTITEIRTDAFRNCISLTNIRIPAGVTTVGDAAFYGCTSLSDITIPAGVTTIGSYAFYDCATFKSVTIPSSVTYIGTQAFGDCTALESITVPFVGEYADGTGSLYFEHIFYELPESLKTVVVTGGTVVGEYAFKDLNNLVSVTLPDTVTDIKTHAFYGCSSLTNINIPSNLKTIGTNAFMNCYSLLSVRIPATVTGIGDGAFANCNKLVEVYNLSKLIITEGFDTNGNIAKNAMAVHTSADAQSILSRDGDYVFINDGADKYLLAYTGTESVLTLPTLEEGSYKIANSAFYKNSFITKVTIPSSVTSVGDYAFYYCIALKDVDMSESSVTHIGIEAFYDCDSLSDVSFSSVLTAIGKHAFYLCYSLDSIELPASLNYIGQYAFGNTDLTSATFENANGWWRTSNEDAIGGTDLDSAELSNSITAAQRLESGYSSYYWKRS